MPIRKGQTANYKHIFIGTKPVKKVYRGSTLVWQSTNPPAISSFTVNPTSIDLDVRPTGNLIFAWAIPATAGQITTARLFRLPEGVQLGASYTSGSGVANNQSNVSVAQPNQPTNYRLVASNVGGSSHSDLSVDVTKNPTLANLRRTNVIHRAGFSTYYFGFTVTGLPRPTVTFDFSAHTEVNNQVSFSHFTLGSNPYTWEISNWAVTFPNANARSLTITATNDSGTATESLSNINA